MGHARSSKCWGSTGAVRSRPRLPADHRICTGLIGGKEVRTDYGRVVSMASGDANSTRSVERSALRWRRANRFVTCGETRRRLGRRNDRLRADRPRWGRRTLSARCSNARAAVRRSPTTVAAQESEFPLRPKMQMERLGPGGDAGAVFLPRLAGYGWCFRKGDYLNIGIGRTDPTELHRFVDEFCSSPGQIGQVGARFRRGFTGTRTSSTSDSSPSSSTRAYCWLETPRIGLSPERGGNPSRRRIRIAGGRRDLGGKGQLPARKPANRTRG